MSEIREVIGNTTTTPVPQPDWTQTDGTKADYIKNKPTILTEDEIINLIETNGGDIGVQSDWNQTDETQLDYIKNKPVAGDIFETTVEDNVLVLTQSNTICEKGEDGYTPQRGVDYWTSEDKEEILNEIETITADNFTDGNVPMWDESTHMFVDSGINLDRLLERVSNLEDSLGGAEESLAQINNGGVE